MSSISATSLGVELFAESFDEFVGVSAMARVLRMRCAAGIACASMIQHQQAAEPKPNGSRRVRCLFSDNDD